MAEYAVYIMANRSGTFYVGVTNDLVRRVDQHRRGEVPGFTRRYHITRLLRAEFYGDVYEAIAREKQIKGWVRRRKEALIREANPERRDLIREQRVPLLGMVSHVPGPPLAAYTPSVTSPRSAAATGAAFPTSWG